MRHIDDVKVMNAAPPTELPNQENREPTSQELMALAERIRDLRVKNDKIRTKLPCMTVLTLYTMWAAKGHNINIVL